MGPEYFWSSGMWIFPTIGLTILLVGGLVAIALIFSRRGFGPPPFRSPMSHDQGTSSGTALEMLKKRYAKGEITKEEFDEMKEDLLYGF